MTKYMSVMLLEQSKEKELQSSMRQEIDTGDLVQVTTGFGRNEQVRTGYVLESKAINPIYNTDRKFHPDEYHCKVQFINGEEETRWIRPKWLKILSKAS